MDIKRSNLEAAAAQGIVSAAQAERLWTFLSGQHGDQPRFTFTHILYYLGGLIAIGAMSLFMTLGWQRFGGWGIFSIALAYAVVGIVLTEHFLYRLRLAIPAGILACFVLVLVPLAVFGLQQALGAWAGAHVYRDYHTLIDWRWIMMEFATLLASAVLLWRYRLPFLVMPVAVTLWYMSMDLAPFLFAVEDADWMQRQWISLWFGLGVLGLALWVDLRTRGAKDYAFWLYLFGVLTFWGGLSLMRSDSELGKFLYLCINLLLIAVGAALARRVFAVFGGLGVTGYLGYLSHRLFSDSAWFPFVLTLIGFGVIYLGILWQRHEAGLSARLRTILPGAVRALIEQRH
jgi:hypothetical protein